MNRWGTLFTLCITGCVIDVQPPEGTNIECTSNADCLIGFECQQLPVFDPDSGEPLRDPSNDEVRQQGRCMREASNNPPIVIVGKIPRSVSTVNIPVTVIDPEGAAVILSGHLASDPETELFAETTTGTAAGAFVTVSWNALAHFGNATYRSGLEIVITPSEGQVAGEAKKSAPFAFGNQEPTIENVDVGGGVARGVTIITFVLSDSTGDPVDITAVELMIPEDGVGFVAIPDSALVLGATEALATNGIIEHALGWDSAAEEQRDVTAAELRVSVTDGYGGTTTGTSSPFAIDNANSPPTLTIETQPSSPLNGPVEFTFTVFDDDYSLTSPELASVEGAISTDGGETWVRASSPSNNTKLVPNTTYPFVWETIQLGSGVWPDVAFRLTPSDAHGEGVGDQVTALEVDNGSGNRPIAGLDPIITGPDLRELRTVAITYELLDVDGDLVSITPRFSRNGSDWYTASEGGGDGIDGLEATPEGATHSFVWDAYTDAQAGLGGLTTEAVDLDGDGSTDEEMVGSEGALFFQITAQDGGGAGVPAIAGPFALGNAAPSVVVSAPQEEQNDFVILGYTLTDALGDTCSLEAQYSLDDTTYHDAVVRLSAVDSATGLVTGQLSSGAGVADILVWDSVAQATLGLGPITAAHRGQVWFRLRPQDHFGAFGGWSSTNFVIRNNTPPVAAISEWCTAGLASDEVELSYSISDESPEDTAQIDVEYRTGGGDWQSASLVGVTAGLPVNSGTSLVVSWNSTADLGLVDVTGVELRMRARDAAEGAWSAATAACRIDNLTPEVLAFRFYDDGMGRMDRVQVQLSEPIDQAQLAAPGGFQAGSGETAVTVDTLSGLDDDVVVLYFSPALLGTAPTGMTYFAAQGTVRDLAGNPMADLPYDPSLLEDHAAPGLVRVQASEESPFRTGPDAGDRVVLELSEDVVATVAIDQTTIEGALALSAGSWLDGDSQIGSATWENPRLLAVVLSDQNGAPTIDVGVTVTMVAGTVEDAAGNQGDTSAVIVGALSKQWLQLTGFEPPERYSHTSAYDPVRQQFLIFSGVDAGSHYYGDSWALDLRPGGLGWRWMQVSHPTGARCNSGGFHEPRRDRFVVFGSVNTDIWTLSLESCLEAWAMLPAGESLGIPALGFPARVVYDVANERMIYWNGSSEIWQLSLGELGSEAWSPVITTTADWPPVRQMPAVVYDGLRQRLIIFGGTPGMADLWQLNLTDGAEAWLELSPTGGPPPGRYAAIAVFDTANDRMVLHSGHRDSPRETFADTWVLDAGTVDGAWTELDFSDPPPQPIPGPRMSGGGAYDAANQQLVVFGGIDMTAVTGVDSLGTWTLDLTEGSESWTLRAPRGDRLTGREYSAMLHDPARNRMLLFGGHVGGPYGNDTWALDLTPGSEGWSQIITAGNPTPVKGHTVILDANDDRVIRFGGRTDEAANATDELWELDLATNTWTELTLPGPPDARGFHTAVYDPPNDRMIVFAGASLAGGWYNDVWELILEDQNEVWNQLSPTGITPSIRLAHAAIYDPIDERMVVYSGYNGGNAVIALSLATAGAEEWTDLGLPLAVRDYHTAVYDSNDHAVLVYGGAATPGELWRLNLTSGEEGWTQITPPGVLAPGRFGHAAAYDPASRRMVVTTGSGFRPDTWWY